MEQSQRGGRELESWEAQESKGGEDTAACGKLGEIQRRAERKQPGEREREGKVREEKSETAMGSWEERSTERRVHKPFSFCCT